MSGEILRNNVWKCKLIALLACLYTVVYLIGYKVGTSSSTSTSTTKALRERSSYDKDERIAQSYKLLTMIGSAKNDLEDTTKSEAELKKNLLKEALSFTKSNMQRSLDNLLRDRLKLTEIEAKIIEEKFSNDVQTELMDLFEEKTKSLLMEAKQSLDDAASTSSATKAISEQSFQVIRDTSTNLIQTKLNEIEHEMEKKIHSIAATMEEQLLKETFDYKLTEEQIETEEYQALLNESKESVLKAFIERKETLGRNIFRVESRLEEKLAKLLVKKKNLAYEDLKDIQEEIPQTLYERIDQLINEELAIIESLVEGQIKKLSMVAYEDWNVWERMRGKSNDSSFLEIFEKDVIKERQKIITSVNDMMKSLSKRLSNELRDMTVTCWKSAFKGKQIEFSSGDKTIIETEFKSIVIIDAKDIFPQTAPSIVSEWFGTH